jgi:osmotically-inducible protein OsmY
MRILTVTTLFGLLTGCSAMLIGEGKSSAPAIGSSDRSSQQIAADEALETAVRSIFSSDSALRSANVTIAAEDAVVTLSGTLSSFELRDHAIGITQDISGVDRVNNQLQVNTRK